MEIKNTVFHFKTKKTYDFIDLTKKVKNFIGKCQIRDGLVNIQTFHTTTTIIINENEPLLKKDFCSHLERLVSCKLDYHHDNFTIRTVNLCKDECVNGHAHCKAILMPTSVVLNLIKGKIQLGQWQRILLLELDKSRERRVQVQIIGE